MFQLIAWSPLPSIRLSILWFLVAHLVPAPASLFPIHDTVPASVVHPPATSYATNTNIDQLLNAVNTTKDTAPLRSPGLTVDISSIVAQEIRCFMNQRQLPTQHSFGQGNSFISSSNANNFLSPVTNCPLLPSDLPVSGGPSSLPAIPMAAMDKIKAG